MDCDANVVPENKNLFFEFLKKLNVMLKTGPRVEKFVQTLSIVIPVGVDLEATYNIDQLNTLHLITLQSYGQMKDGRYMAPSMFSESDSIVSLIFTVNFKKTLIRNSLKTLTFCCFW